MELYVAYGFEDDGGRLGETPASELLGIFSTRLQAHAVLRAEAPTTGWVEVWTLDEAHSGVLCDDSLRP